VDDTITVHDFEGRILDINEAACRRLGYTREELLGMNVADLDEPGTYAEGFAERLRQQLADGQLSGINGAHITKDGRRIDIEVNSKVINYHGQRAVLAVVRDVTERKRAEHQLRENEARYRAVVEYQTEFIVRWKPDGTRTFVNEAYCRYLDQPRERLVGHKFMMTTDEIIRSIVNRLSRSRDGEPLETDTYRLIRPDGSTGWIEWFDHGIFDEDGQLVEIQSVGRDVTERILMGEQVRQERDRAQQYLDIAGVMLVALNARGEIVMINRKGREILGYAEEELIGQNWFKRCLPPDTVDQVRAYFQEVVNGNIVAFEHYENPVITKGGEQRLIAWHNTLLHDATGGVLGSLSSGEDITERRHNEEALRAQRTLAEALRDITALINSTLDPARVFDRILTNLGRVVPHEYADIMMIEDGVAHVVSFHSLLDFELSEEAIRKVKLPLSETPNLRQMAESGQPFVIGDAHDYPDWVDVPESRWIRSYVGMPIRVTGETIGFINANSTQPHFFTQEHVERLQAFADQAATAINNARAYDDLERRVIDRTIDLSVRNAVAETLSNTLETGPMLDGVLRTIVERLDVTGGAIHLIADDDSDARLTLAAHYGMSFDMISRITGIVSGDTFLHAIKNLPNHTVPPPETGIFARLNVPIWRQGQIHGVITLVRDQPHSWRNEETRMLDAIGRQIGVALVNARLYAEALRDEAHIRTILQSVAEGLLVFDQDDNLMLVNPAAAALFSFYPSESGGAEHAAALLWDWLRIHPNLPDEPVEFSVPTAAITQFESIPVDDVCLLLDHTVLEDRDPYWPCWLLPGLPPGTNVRLCPIYERILRRVLQASSAVVRDVDGETLGTVIALHDVTYFHELDELKGRFVSTVSHELRTPLSVVLLQVSTLIKYYDRLADAQRREMVGEIQQQAHVLRELIEDILELSRFDAHRSMPQKQWFDLSGHCDELLQSLEPSLREKHLDLTVQQRLASTYVRADPQQVMRVLRNLLSNAIKYTADGGKITLEMASAGPNVRLTIADTGIGIAPEEKPYVFDRFYRAERASRMASGTGLGLAITKEIVDLHGGRIEVDSTPGEGSRFTIYLPVYNED
jgi:PAS domain S-box-containing protein